MAFNKFVAVFLVCIVFGVALNAEIAVANADGKFRSCINDCIKQCIDSKQGYTVCEMRCDSECSNKEIMDKLKTRFN